MQETTEGRAPRTTPPQVAAGAAVELESVTKCFGAVVAVDGLSLRIQRGEFFVLLGPSGCGKTTLLRLVAGLELPDAGVVRLGDRDMVDLPAHRRPVNTVFQSYALFPHLNVRENVGFGLRMKKVPRAQREPRVNDVMSLVQIAPLADRRPGQLSGGEKQRVALARAIVNEPQVLLLDEPLGALDLQLRKQLQLDLHALQRRLGMTFLYVTHDQQEALVLADCVAVMNRGRIEQLGSAAEVYERPRTRFVAQFIGSCNLLTGVICTRGERGVTVATELGEMAVQPSATQTAKPVGTACSLAVRPEKLQVRPRAEGSGFNLIQARVRDRVYAGSATQYELEAQGTVLRAWVLNLHLHSSALEPGQAVSVFIPPEALVVLED